MKLTGLVALYNLATILFTKWGIAMKCDTENCRGTASLIDHESLLNVSYPTLPAKELAVLEDKDEFLSLIHI